MSMIYKFYDDGDFIVDFFGAADPDAIEAYLKEGITEEELEFLFLAWNIEEKDGLAFRDWIEAHFYPAEEVEA